MAGILDKIVASILTRSQQKATGRLALCGRSDSSWFIYYASGCFVWASGGMHPYRRWQRQVESHAAGSPRLKLAGSQAPTPGEMDAFPYFPAAALDIFCEEPQVLRALIAGTVREVLFECFQYQIRVSRQHHHEGVPEQLDLTWNNGICPSEDGGSLPPNLGVEVEPLLEAARSTWTRWEEAGFTEWSPNSAPTICKADVLQCQTSAVTYQNLQNLLNGSLTLRDLAVRTNRDVLQIALSLSPFIRQGAIALRESGDTPQIGNAPLLADALAVADRPKRGRATPETVFDVSLPQTSETPRNRSIAPIVACVDDSPLITQTMEAIVTSAGYGFIGVNDGLRASAMLLKHKPSIIFLDLVMPNTNGYEICTRLRKVSAFRDIPVVILTGKDGIVDRVRAKLVGSSDFLNKPIDAATVLAAVRKYLPDVPSTVHDSRRVGFARQSE